MNASKAAAPAVGLLVTSDLIFSTKITGTARAMGMDMGVVASAAAALDRLATQSPCCVILDLSVPGLVPDAIRSIVDVANCPVLAFGSHVDTDRLAAATAAGCTEVMPRSRLAASLPQLLVAYLGPNP